MEGLLANALQTILESCSEIVKTRRQVFQQLAAVLTDSGPLSKILSGVPPIADAIHTGSCRQSSCPCNRLQQILSALVQAAPQYCPASLQQYRAHIRLPVLANILITGGHSHSSMIAVAEAYYRSVGCSILYRLSRSRTAAHQHTPRLRNTGQVQQGSANMRMRLSRPD